MKTILRISLWIWFLGISLYVQAVPADPTPFIHQQSDGTVLTVRLHGDEFAHFYTTLDGYTLVDDMRGDFVYAALADGKLQNSDVVAHDAGNRNAHELQYLAHTQKYMQADNMQTRALASERNARYRQDGLLTAPHASSTNFRGIIILAEFTDKKFSFQPINELIDAIVNQPNYADNGFTGSVRDYFYDNSMGQFDPQFDVLGLVTLDYRQADAKGFDNGQLLVRNACIKAASLTRFSDYDMNGDGEVDLIYVIFAGGGSHAGNNKDFMWPHSYALNELQIKLHGVYCNRYACSTELTGRENRHKLDGIGTICHEFSHVLGLPDLYDTNRNEAKEAAPDPDQWSVMAGGNYLNDSRTPCGFSLYERYALGWSQPTLLSESGSYTLEALLESNHGYRINTAVDKEFFLLENRQQTGWDSHLPGHGMLVFRVDSTNAKVWSNNMVNTDPEHLYYELLRADHLNSNSAGNPFPGTGNKTLLTNTTSPSLLSWTGALSELIVEHIREDDGRIAFDIQALSTGIRKEATAPAALNAYRDGDCIVIVSDNLADEIYVYTESGMGIMQQHPNGTHTRLNLPGKSGLYVIKQGKESIKLY
jgi:M6 family metalloprotease-like protein